MSHSHVAVGAFAMDANTTGDNNTAIGYASLSGNTTANNNTAIGNQALFSNVQQHLRILLLVM